MNTLIPEVVQLRVFGVPAPKGSHALINGRVVAAGDAALQRWERAVRASATATYLVATGEVEVARPLFENRPLVVEMTLALPRESGKKRRTVDRRPHAHFSNSDLDKLVRATLDPLQGIVFDNDRRIVMLHARKVYSGESYGLRGTGALIDVWPLNERDEEDWPAGVIDVWPPNERDEEDWRG